MIHSLVQTSMYKRCFPRSCTRFSKIRVYRRAVHNDDGKSQLFMSEFNGQLTIKSCTVDVPSQMPSDIMYNCFHDDHHDHRDLQ